MHFKIKSLLSGHRITLTLLAKIACYPGCFSKTSIIGGKTHFNKVKRKTCFSLL